LCYFRGWSWPNKAATKESQTVAPGEKTGKTIAKCCCWRSWNITSECQEDI